MDDKKRPYSPAKVLAILQSSAALLTRTPADSEPDDNPRRVGLFAGMLGQCLGGDKDKRHLVVWAMFRADDTGTVKALSRAQICAWLNEYVTQDALGYTLRPYAEAEMNRVYTYALRETGQGVMDIF